MENRSPTIGTILLYSLPLLGGGAINFFLSSYLMKYATDVLLLSPFIVGALFALSRVWDAVSDPICGHLSDSTSNKLGRRRIWLLYSTIPLFLSFSAIWYTPAENVALKSIWFGAWLFILFTALTMLYVPHYSLGSEISYTDKDRARVFGIRSVFENAGTIMAALLLGVLAGFSEIMDSHVIFMSLVAFLTVVFIALTVSFSREKKHVRSDKHFSHSLKIVWKNQLARPLLMISFCTQAGATLLLSSALYFARYILNSEQSGAQIAALFLVSATLSVPLWIGLSVRFGKDKTLFSGLLLLAFIFIPVFLVKIVLPEITVYPLSAMLGLAAGAVLTLQPASLSSAVESEEKKSGHRIDGMFFAVFTFVNKSAMAVAAFIIGAVLQYTGFSANSVQEYPAIMGIRVLFTILPLLFFAAAAWLHFVLVMQRRQKN